MNSNDFVVGIDGCKYGWVASKLSYNRKLNFSLHYYFEELIEQYCNAIRLFVDVPIGLMDDDYRKCDMEGRKLLGQKGSSLFPIPIRDAIYSEDYTSGCKKNYTVMGKKFSKQAWNILPRVREVDRYLMKNKNLAIKLYESHPELCFYQLNKNVPIFTSKKTSIGQTERLEILSEYLSSIEMRVNEFLKQTKRRDVLIDDIIDSVVLALAAQIFSENRCVPIKMVYDKNNLPMNIYY